MASDIKPSFTTTIVIMLFLILVMLLVVNISDQQRCRADFANEQYYSSSLNDQVNTLIAVNQHLRDTIIDMNENLSRMSVLQQMCLQQLPALEALRNSSPKNRILASDVQLRDDAVIINMRDVTQGIIAPTRSMVPILDANNTVLEVTPERPSDIYVGDIIVYELDGVRIIHRVIRIGVDNLGWYAVAKGDNNAKEDPAKVRFEQVRGVVVGIIY